jgi:short subunit dehydrogenase-like uncharacterized protein
MRAVAVADQEGPFPDRALAELSYSGSSEGLITVLLVQGASAILSDHGLRKKLGGGMLTPACLGMPLVERLRSAGVEIESTLV